MRPILTILSMFCFLAVSAQNSYNILKVEGCVKDVQSTSCLVKGSTLKGNETLNFDKPSTFAVLMNSTGELLTIKSPDTAGYSNGRSLQFSFTEAASITKSDEKTTTRGTANQQITNFNEFIGKGRFTVIGDEARFGLSPRLYPVSKDKFLVLNYNLDTAKVSKRLGFRDQVIRIQKSRLNEFNGNVYDKSKIEGVNLYYYEPATKSTERIASFDLVFISMEQLNADFDDVYRTLPENAKKTPQELTKALETFFVSFYGKTEPQSLKFAIDEYVAKQFNK
ncbi:MAG: hypothetical protein AB9846_17450 [Tenuifilaceae bacterium]